MEDRTGPGILVDVPQLSRHRRDMKSQNIEVRVTPDEKAAMRSAAEREGLSLSSWVRSVLLKAARQ